MMLMLAKTMRTTTTREELTETQEETNDTNKNEERRIESTLVRYCASLYRVPRLFIERAAGPLAQLQPLRDIEEYSQLFQRVYDSCRLDAEERIAAAAVVAVTAAEASECVGSPHRQPH